MDPWPKGQIEVKNGLGKNQFSTKTFSDLGQNKALALGPVSGPWKKSDVMIIIKMDKQ